MSTPRHAASRQRRFRFGQAAAPGVRGILLAVCCQFAGAALAQSAAPPPPALSPAPRTEAAKPAAPRPTIQLSPAERQAIDAREATPVRPLSIEEALTPTADDLDSRADTKASDANVTRIEQRRQYNRISEVIVTPPGQWSSYVMTNREFGQPYGALQQSGSGLSVPMFLRFEFGKPAPAITPPLPAPPPSSSPPPSR